MDESEARQIAKQLRQPDGPDGLEVAERLNTTNAEMIETTIEILGLSDGHSVLELGPGNAQHVVDLLTRANNIDYTALEISETMVAEASARNSTTPPSTSARFLLYDGLRFPSSDEEFDRLFTVNTLYFWEEPALMLSEIYRVLKPTGRAVISFVDASFLNERPFAQYGFTPYDAESITELVARSAFKTVELGHHEDQVTSPEGDLWDRGYVSATLTK